MYRPVCGANLIQKEEAMEQKVQASFKGVVPFLIFIVLYLGAGIVFQMRGTPMAFYQVPAPVAILAAIAAAFFLFKGSINQKFSDFIDGCGNHDIVIMCMIYILAGAFATVTKTIGGVEAAANFGLSIIPVQFIAAGIFLISCFISISIGTSVGTVVALAPIALELANKSGVGVPLMLASVLCGAMFGDNLSFISDTTIAATRSQGCEMKDKFRANVAISFPAAIIAAVLLLIFARPEQVISAGPYTYDLIKVLPYLFVLIAAALGVNVFVVLGLGTVFAGIIGLSYQSFTFIGWVNEVYKGFTSMTEIFLLSMLTGGLAKLSAVEGGIGWILQSVKKFIKGKKTAELGIGILAWLTAAATANNTVAIIIDGPVAKEISNKYALEPKRVASYLDLFSCIAQGILPYGAQMLILLSFTNGAVNPLQVLPYMWYNHILLIVALISIIVYKRK